MAGQLTAMVAQSTIRLAASRRKNACEGLLVICILLLSDGLRSTTVGQYGLHDALILLLKNSAGM